MTLNYSTPVVNPRLGSSFAIFASAYICLVIMLVILEQLGLSAATIDQLIIVLPACFYAAIGFLTRTINLEDFFVSGQRVPPFYNALALCAIAFGGSILLGSIGSFFFIGIDALAIPLGCFAGLVLTACVFVPYLRKAGAYTLPGFLHLRFGKISVRTVASLLMLLPCMLILMAEISIGSKIVGYFLPPPVTFGFGMTASSFFTLLVMGSVAVTVILGGMRSATWTQCAQFIVFLGILVPLTVVSVMRTNLPLPQLTYGSQLEHVKALEATKGFVGTSQPQPLGKSLPTPAPQPLVRPVERSLSALRPIDFALLVFCLATGIAAHPAFLPRLSTTPTILASRRSLGWTSVVAAFIVLMIPAYAFFTKDMAVSGLIGVPASDIPTWGKTLQQLGLVSLPVNQFDNLSSSARATFERDSVALILPIAAGLPRVFLGLAAASAVAALSACASGHLVAVANTVSDDLYHGSLHKTASPSRRLAVARLTMILLGCLVFALLQGRQVDPLRWVISALSLTSATFFAVLLLAIWWRKLSGPGAIAGMVAGFSITAFYLNAGGTALFGVDSLTAAAIGLPVSLVAAIIVSVVTPPSDSYALEAVDELRVPAGETLQSRMQRLTARGKLQRST